MLFAINMSNKKIRYIIIMIDEQRQALTFQKNYNQFKTLFKIIPEEQSLQIKVQDSLGFRRYELKITQSYLEEHPEYNCFRDPIDIFDFVSQHFDRIIVEEQVIRFQYAWGITLKKNRQIAIMLNEQELDHNKITHLRIEKLIKDLNQKDLKINELEQRLSKKDNQLEQNILKSYQQIETGKKQFEKLAREQQEKNQDFQYKLQRCLGKVQQVDELRQRVDQFEKKMKNIEKKVNDFTEQIKQLNVFTTRIRQQQKEQNYKLKQSLSKCSQESYSLNHALLSEIQERNKRLESKQEQLTKEYRSLSKQLKKLIKMEVQVEPPKMLPPILFCNHTGNSHAQYYQIKNIGGSSVKVTRVGLNSRWLTFVNKNQILPKQTAKFKVKLNKITDNDLSVGFCTSAGFGNTQSYSSHECIYYWCKSSGQIWKMGGQKSTNLGASKDGDIVECEADLSNDIIRWWKNGNKLTESEVPPEMKGKTIYLSLIMYYTNDNVDLL